jgi:hypothetical protein
MERNEHEARRFGAGADVASPDVRTRDTPQIAAPSKVSSPLMPSDTLAGRFVIDRLAGSGGMGNIYRATDLSTQGPVAIKVLGAESSADAKRFATEAKVLSQLRHPAIVRYIAFGTTPRAAPFLAMEWLEGEDLSQRLRRSPLSVAETMLLLRRACEGLSEAHALGIVHRDLKPSNLFLVERDPAQLKLLDFGIARQRDDTRTITQAGTILGTVGYMSPEQAWGKDDVDSRTDVFALGCVLFECLTGRAAFVGANAVAVLAKVLREDPPRVSELRPDRGDELDPFVERLLAKNPERRPRDALALMVAIDEVAQTLAGKSSSVKRSTGVSAAEQKIVSAILGVPLTGEPLVIPASVGMRSVQEVTRRFGAELVPLRGGGILILLSGGQAATDQARQAARCALQLSEAQLELSLAIVTGRTEAAGPMAVGEVIDRAAALLDRPGDASATVAIDELTAGLLDADFELRRAGSGLVLTRVRAEPDSARLLMGKPTPFVGRDKELELLLGTLRECSEESVARAVLVTGAPGQGKSRLRQEFVKRARAQRRLKILFARADPIGAGSAFLLVRQLICQAIGLRENDLGSQQLAAVRAHAAELCSGAHSTRIADFLCELIGLAAVYGSSPELRAARGDPQIMSVWLRRSFGEWLAEECSAVPLLIVIEDLHWGDLPSVTYLGEALRVLASQPLMVLALARPEVHSVFPQMWHVAETQTIALGRLTSRAAEQLVRETLGDQLEASVRSRIVERADGNAFCLEELIRCVAQGERDKLPETALALVQSRLERLDPEARRVVRAASVFGEAFWVGGVGAVLGATPRGGVHDAWLRRLCEEELFASSDHDSRFDGETEYTFRHGLVREAAYAMLTDADRRSAHALAGDWLARAGERDAVTLASHFELGGARARAVPWFLKAAYAALGGGNVADALQFAERGLACGASGIEEGQLHQVRAQVSTVRGDWRDAIESNRRAARLLPVASPPWFAAMSGAVFAGTFVADLRSIGEAIQALMRVPVRPEASGPFGMATFLVSHGLAYAQKLDDAEAFIARAQEIAADDLETDLVFRMWLCCARAYVQLVRGDLGGANDNASAAWALAERTGAAIGGGLASLYAVAVLGQTGHLERTTAAARAALACSEPIGLRIAKDWVTFYLAWASARASADLESRVIAPLRTLLDRNDRRLVISARAVLAFALLEAGDVVPAEREIALAANDSLFASERAMTQSIRALIELRLARPEVALACAARAVEDASVGGFPWTGSLAHIAYARALHASDRVEQARAAIRVARDRIMRIAATLHDPEFRDSYLSDIEANAQTIALARTWLAEE